MNLLSGRKRPLVFVLVAVIVTYALFFYLQTLHEKNLSEKLIQRSRDRQGILTASITQNIGSDLDGAVQRIKALSEKPIFEQEGSENLKKEMAMTLSDIRKIAPYDELFIIYQNHSGLKIVSDNENRTTMPIPISINLKNLENNVFNNFLAQSLLNSTVSFSPGYYSDGKLRIAITVPIFESNTSDHLGLIGVSVPALDLVERYGNVLDTTKLRLVFYDKNATLLAGYPLPNSVIGHSMFSPANQEIITPNGRTPVNQLFHNTISGKVSISEFDLGDGMRLVTSSPIFAEGHPVYFLNTPNPFSQILSPIRDLLNTELILNLVILAAFTVAVIYLVSNLIRWNNKLESKVQIRTKELEHANKSLQAKTVELEKTNQELNIANEQLKLHDRLQNEFVNIAAHELRTPAQAIVGYAELLDKSDERNKSYERTLLRNAERLYRLTSDILDVSRIESGTLKLEKINFDINDKIKNVINDVSEGSSSTLLKRKIKIVFEQTRDPILVHADKARIFQVISNLLTNAIKFTDNGIITLSAEKNDLTHEAIVTVTDTGTGISLELLPRIFEKFVGKSESGTGLGLYISKNIVEAHGGKIEAHNNPNGKGAIFKFRLPLA